MTVSGIAAAQKIHWEVLWSRISENFKRIVRRAGDQVLLTCGIHAEERADEAQWQENNGYDGECVYGRVMTILSCFDLVFALLRC